MFLLDHLIADSRLDIATDKINDLEKIDSSFRVNWYKGRVEKAKGNIDKAFNIFNKMIEVEPSNWLTYATRANELAKAGLYDQAILDYNKAITLQEKPKYTDSYECLALIYKLKKEPQNAIKAYEGALSILKDDWNITIGNQVNKIKGEIKKLL